MNITPLARLIAGRGTEVTVTFPAGKQVPEHIEAPHAQDALEGTGEILLVDDEGIVLMAAGEMIKHLSYKVVTAGGGEEALAIFRERKERSMKNF